MKEFIKWVEIPTSDFDRAVTFYGQVFKLELTPVNFGNEQMACFPGGEGALISHPDYKPGANGAMVSFRVPDTIKETVERIAQFGCKVLQPRTCIDEKGSRFFAVFLDPEGNRVGLYEQTRQ